MVGGKFSFFNNRRIVLWLLAATVLYQIVYQSVLLHILKGAEDGDAQQCAAGADTSPRCLELQLFRSWRQAEEQGHQESGDDLLHIIVQSRPSNLSSKNLTAKVNQLYEGAQWKSMPIMQPPSAAKSDDQSSFIKSSIIIGAAESATPVTWSPITEWGRGLEAIQGHFEAQMEKLPSVRKAHALEKKQSFDKLYNDTLAAIHNRSSHSPWADELLNIQTSLQGRADNLTRQHERLFARKEALHAAYASDTGLTLLDEIYTFGRQMCEEPHRRSYPSCAKFINQTHAERRAGQEADFAKASANLDHGKENIKAEHQKWQHDVSDDIATYMHDLCADPHRQDYHACVKFRASETDKGNTSVGKDTTTSVGESTATSATEGSRSSLRGASTRSYSQRLSWSSVVDWEGKKRQRATQRPDPVVREQLRFQKWQGKIPKVACIVAVPPGKDTHARMKYFLNNFRLQTYEGPKQLLLVYRHIDQDIAELVQEHADGTFVKGVASRDGHIPSTSTFRYAAWSSDADIIARWNLDDWHHPEQLAMQVRALAYSSVPVSILSRWTLLTSEHAGAVGQQIKTADPGCEGSLMGEAKWMREHWMPDLKEERSMLAGVQSHWIVQVDMPELLVHSSPLPETTNTVVPEATNTVAVEENVHIQPVEIDNTGLAARVSAVCDKQHEQPSESLSATNSSSLGGDFGKTYESLVNKRSEVAGSLHKLCDEMAEEHDQSTRQVMVEQAEHISQLQEQLADHFVALNGLFHNM